MYTITLTIAALTGDQVTKTMTPWVEYEVKQKEFMTNLDRRLVLKVKNFIPLDAKQKAFMIIQSKQTVSKFKIL